MPIISKNETTRSGVESHISGNNCGTASISPTVVVPVRRSIRAPARQEAAYSAELQLAFVEVITFNQSVKIFGGGNSPAIWV